MTVKAFLTIGVGAKKVGNLELELYDDVVPRTVKNFISQLEENFKGCKFHRIIKNFMAQGGDFTRGDGTGGESIYGRTFQDENFIQRHDQRGVLSMANSGPNTNGSQFFITFRPTPHLNGKHVVFGRVVSGENVLTVMENISTGRNNVPRVPVVILDCGIVNPDPVQNESNSNQIDDNEIDLDEDDQDEAETQVKSQSKQEISSQKNKDVEFPDDGEEDVAEETTGKASIKDRVRRLKMKMNQARQLNRQEVLREGERLGSEEGKVKERQRQLKEEKYRKTKEWETNNAKALRVASSAGIDGKYMVDQAGDSLNRAMRKEEKVERNRYSVKDYHNPEGQYRNYERNVKSLPQSLDRDETSTYDPISATTSNVDQKTGAIRLANELKRRIEKQRSKRGRDDFEATDVSYINQRNKRFNQKIARNYDKQTAEIKQNLERGTAL